MLGHKAEGERDPGWRCRFQIDWGRWESRLVTNGKIIGVERTRMLGCGDERNGEDGGYANMNIIWNGGYELANIPNYLKPVLVWDKTKLHLEHLSKCTCLGYCGGPSNLISARSGRRRKTEFNPLCPLPPTHPHTRAQWHTMNEPWH